MNLIQKLKNLRISLFHKYYLTKPIKKNKIIAWSDSFKNFGCNPKYICLYLLKHYPGKFDIVWVFDQNRDIPLDFPKEIRYVRYFSKEYLYEISTAKFIICNSRTGTAHFFKKRDEQKYIQTWHSSIRLKKIEKDAEQSLPKKYIENAINDSKKIDIIVSGCDFSTNIFKNSFWYNGQILKSGTPRSDVLLNSEDNRKKVYDFYNISYDKKLVLYAPTFRNNKKADLYGFDFKELSTVLDENEYAFAYRLHPNITENLNVSDNIISMSKYPDMQELLSACDILFTDYSSCMFDMAIAKKKCFLYVPDLEEYISKERGLYFDINNLPFSLSKKMDDLCENIKIFNEESYISEIESFMKEIGSYEDGNAAKRISEYIISNLDK